MTVSRRGFFGWMGAATIGGTLVTEGDRSNRFEVDRIHIAGFQFHEGLRLLAKLRAGESVTLHAEPENIHDKAAVRIDWNGLPLGYVPKRYNRTIGRLLSQGAPLTGEITQVIPQAKPWQMVEVAIHVVAMTEGSTL